jgi:hypothetical protein
MSLSIVVNGGGTFTASMEEGPVSFTASLAAVGPQGPAGATGPGVAVGGTAGEVLAKASGTNYDTEWVARNPFNQELNTTDSVSFEYVNVSNAFGIDGGDVLFKDSLILSDGVVSTQLDTTQGLSLGFGGITFPDSTTQTTALPSGIDDGYIVAWNADTSAYDSVPNDARTLFLNGTNKTGTTIAKGKAVYISGSTGNHPEITLAIATSEATSARTIGITSEAIANNGTGRVIVAGLLENVDTSAFSAGDVLYLSSSSAGGFQTTLPTQPNHGVLLGYVTRSNANTGVIEVRVDNYQELGEQSDVLLTSKTNLDLLSYETSSGLWKNKSFSTLGLLTSATAATTYAAIASTNTFTASQVISVTDNSNAALRVTQLGTGEAFRVEDSANPDSSPFVIDAAGDVGIGSVPSSGSKLNIQGNLRVIGSITQLGSATITVSSGSGVPLTVTNSGSGASFRVNDEASDTTPFIVDAGGNVGVKTASPSTDFEVNGNAQFTTGNITTAPAAADSSSLIPTTAWVQAEVPAASTTAAGKVELATDAEALTKTDATRSLTPFNLARVLVHANVTRFNSVTFDTGTSGTGGTNAATGGGLGRTTNGPTSVGAGHVRAGMLVIPILGGSSASGINWSRQVRLAARIIRTATSPSSESIYRLVVGEPQATNTGDIPNRGIGIRVVGSGAMEIMAHDGTSLTTYTTSHTPAATTSFDLILVSDGAGTVEAFVNGSSVGSTTGGPTGAASTNQNYMNVRVENTSSFTANPLTYQTWNIATDIVYT